MNLHQNSARDSHARSFAVSQDALQMLDSTLDILMSQFAGVVAEDDEQLSAAKVLYDLASVCLFAKATLPDELAAMVSDGLEVVMAQTLTASLDAYGKDAMANAVAMAIVDADPEDGDDDEYDTEDDGDIDEGSPEDCHMALRKELSPALIEHIRSAIARMPEAILLGAIGRHPTTPQPGIYYASDAFPDVFDAYEDGMTEACELI